MRCFLLSILLAGLLAFSLPASAQLVGTGFQAPADTNVPSANIETSDDDSSFWETVWLVLGIL